MKENTFAFGCRPARGMEVRPCEDSILFNKPTCKVFRDVVQSTSADSYLFLLSFEHTIQSFLFK